MDYALKKQQNLASLKPNRKYEKSEAPNFVETSYHRDYSSTIVPSPTKSAKRMEVRLMGGGKLNADTTYNHNYRVKTEAFESAKPIIHKKYVHFYPAIRSFSLSKTPSNPCISRPSWAAEQVPSQAANPSRSTTRSRGR
jgi:hypothetical protein